jgi:hypothetical protein
MLVLRVEPETQEIFFLRVVSIDRRGHLLATRRRVDAVRQFEVRLAEGAQRYVRRVGGTGAGMASAAGPLQ